MTPNATPLIPHKPTWADQSRERGAAFLDSLIANKRQILPTGRKRLPPFGKKLMEVRRNGLVPRDGVTVVLGMWDYGQHRARVVIPHDLDVSVCRFDYCAGADCFLIWDTDLSPVSRVRKAINEILRCNPRRLVVVGLWGEISQLEWIKTERDGILEGYAA